MNKVLSIILSLAIFSGYAVAGGEGWINDFEKAKEIAAKEKKDILIDFTGSDWCGWCIKLKDEVFSKEHFKKEAPKKFVLLEIDFPRDKSKMSEETIKQNDEMAKQFEIKGYPTIMLTNAKGQPYGQTGYRDGGPEKYIEHLNEYYSHNQSFQKLIDKAEATKDDAEKAKILDEAISLMDDNIISKYFSQYQDMIIKLDTDNALGLKNKYLLKQELPNLFALQNDPEKFIAKADDMIKTLQLKGDDLEYIQDAKVQIQIQAKIKKIAGLQNEPEKLLAGVDDIITDLKLEGKYKQQMLTQKAMINLHLIKDYDAALAEIDKAIEVAPDSPDGKMLAEMKTKIIEEKNSKKEDEM